MQKNITFSADDRLIQKAREKAHKNKQSLNVVFRQWLTQYAIDRDESPDYLSLMKRLKHIKPGKHFSRDDFNER